MKGEMGIGLFIIFLSFSLYGKWNVPLFTVGAIVDVGSCYLM